MRFVPHSQEELSNVWSVLNAFAVHYRFRTVGCATFEAVAQRCVIDFGRFGLRCSVLLGGLFLNLCIVLLTKGEFAFR